ncbi:MAG: glutathione S-transferase [bacterium]|nr:glutathione S-transferase [bacterium]
MSEPYVLYGSYASYATAKTRSYLRKKGIPFVERVPGVARFREYVRPASENHRIPQLEAPDGTVVQDTTAIFDYLEARHPEPPAYPPGPRQQLIARLFESLLDFGLGRTAWHYRWNFMDENYGFVGREFGRSFRPGGTNEELDHYGRVIADRMEGKRTAVGVNEKHFTVLESIYFDTLDILERHFTVHPYLFGGLPSIADHVLMGPLFGHLARDPVPSMLMKQRAPRVFRWTEQMNTPEIASPEFPDAAECYLANDEIPETTIELLQMFLRDVGDNLIRSAELFNAWAAEHSGLSAGSFVSEKEFDEPAVGHFESELRGVPAQSQAGVYPLWVLQRTLDWFQTLPPGERKSCETLLRKCDGEVLLKLQLGRRLTRVRNRMAVDE